MRESGTKTEASNRISESDAKTGEPNKVSEPETKTSKPEIIKELETNSLLDLNKTIAKDIFTGTVYPCEVLNKIEDFIISLGEKLPETEYIRRDDNIWISVSANVYPSAHITGPAIIDEGAEIRHCAFIRGNVIVGKGAVVGNSTELKNVILFDEVQVPHYNYVGDSVLGYKAHMGAGSITSNVKSDKSLVEIKCYGRTLKTERKKVGAVLGDYVEVGCGAILNPGTVIGRKTHIYPLSSVRGYIIGNNIYKNKNEVVERY